MKKTQNPVCSSAIRHVFLDRDGVLNRKLPEGQYVKRCEDLVLLPGAAEALARLNDCGFTVILVTNQRGIGLGLMIEEDLHRLHEELAKNLAAFGARLDAIYYCPHDPSQQLCGCRKPQTGLFERAMCDFPGIAGENSVVIGDSLSDIQAGLRMGMHTIFVEGDPLFRKSGREQAIALANAVVGSLKEAVDTLLQISAK